MSPRPILVFDVNETLLDLNSLSPLFERIFKDANVMREWFAQLILYSQSLTLCADYVDFGKLGAAVLQMLGQIKSQEVTDKDLQDLRTAMSSLKPHADVRDSLRRLREAGFRMVTLTNNTLATASEQLHRGEIADFFDQTFSVDDLARRFKPAFECYTGVAKSLGVTPAQCLLVACHTWDTMGAASAGMRSALILRDGNAPLSIGRQSDFIGQDLPAFVNWLIAVSDAA